MSIYCNLWQSPRVYFEYTAVCACGNWIDPWKESCSSRDDCSPGHLPPGQQHHPSGTAWPYYFTRIKLENSLKGHGDVVVTLSPPTSEIRVWIPVWPHVGKLIVVCCWSAVYITEPWPTVCTGFLCPPSYSSQYNRWGTRCDITH